MGHFLKGSSATLGLSKVKESCEKIPHLGAGRDETGDNPMTSEDDSLKQINKVMTVLKEEVKEAERLLNKFYHV